LSYEKTDQFVFPKWVNYLLPLIVVSALGGATVVPPLVLYGGSAETLNVGYQPDQPVPYSHAIHVGKLGMDCTACHNTVDKAAFASIPPTSMCINCHAPGKDLDGIDTGMPGVHQASLNLRPVWESHFTGDAIPWVKIHDLADYAYFNHSAHVNKGVGCVSCHGRVDKMGGAGTQDPIAGVYQVNNLSMGWCLECHREPEKHLRPLDKITAMDWSPLNDPRVKAAVEKGELKDENDEQAAQLWLGAKLKKQYEINSTAYMQACSTCHR
jgi:hypothetical protein